MTDFYDSLTDFYDSLPALGYTWELNFGDGCWNLEITKESSADEYPSLSSTKYWSDSSVERVMAAPVTEAKNLREVGKDLFFADL